MACESIWQRFLSEISLAQKSCSRSQSVSSVQRCSLGDVTKLNWEDITYFQKPHGRFIQIYIRISKNNMLNSVPQCLTLKEHSPKTLECPVTLLEKFRELQHQPNQGRIFNNCTGQSLLRIAQLTALEHNITRPTGHSARVSAAITCSDLNIGLRRTNNFLGWKSDVMYSYYSNIRDQLSANAPASLLADKDTISKLQLNLFRK